MKLGKLFIAITFAIALIFNPLFAQNININNASEKELTTLKGIGKSKAKAIIEYREQNGDFTNINELQNVTGIGKKTFEAIQTDITLSGTDNIPELDE